MKKITMAEIMLLSITVVLSTAVLFLPYLTAQAAGQDAWISVLLAGLLATAPAAAAAAVMNRFPKQSVIQVLPKLFGKILGRAMALILIGFFAFSAVLVLQQLDEFVAGTLITRTPELAIRFLFLLGVAYAVFSGATPLIRTNDYITPLGVIVIGIVLILPVTRMDPSFLFPVLEKGVRPMFNGAILLLGWMAQIPLVILMMHRYVETTFLKRCSLKAVMGILLTTAALELGALGTIAAFGPEQTATMFYPSFIVARSISVGNFLEHIEVVFVGIWIAAMFVGASFYFQAWGDGIADLFNIKGKKSKIWIYAFTFLAALIGLELLSMDIYTLLKLIREVAPLGSIAVGGILPLVMLALAALVPPDEKNQTPEESDADTDKESNDNPKGNQDKQNSKGAKDTNDSPES